ncbi:glycosyltransferase [Pseudomaricurvus alcaniphilus]|uniref:glycosyltransferase n=1 Tax=Pseudomaricurvus alcaniphilus TaxID=1166482 RepID=UPI00140BED0B|nr:glycosyltransferase [Pseudomaricurvus alcaniphilus]NHN39580.1 glycosyltransferase [Pseudomaricurvus alcaniphilus]
MKILVLTNGLSRNAGGLFYSVRNLSIEINKIEGFEVEVVGLKDEYFDEDYRSWDGVKVRAFRSIRFFKKFDFSLSLFFYVLRSRADLIHLHGVWNFASLTLLVRSLIRKTIYVVSPRGMLDEWIFTKNPLIKSLYWRLFERKLVTNSCFVHALNRSEASSVKKLLPSVSVVVSPNGVAGLAKLDRNFESIEKKMIFIGRIDRKKGVLELIYAWSKISQYNNWSLDIYGWGSSNYIEEVKAAISSLKVNNVRLYGSLYGDEKVNVLNNSDAFILPSFSEGLPMAVLEAWAYGLPVLMTRECNLEDSFDCGVAFKLSLGDGLHQDISRYLNANQEFQMEMSKKALAYVEKRYLWCEIANQFSRYYLEAKAADK